MKFSEIKDKIQNLGELKSLAEIKAAGLRVVRNSKTGDYWLIEKEFLKPVLKSPQELKKYKFGSESLKKRVVLCNMQPTEIEESKLAQYFHWGESINTHKNSTCAQRAIWWKLPYEEGNLFWVKEIRKRIAVFRSDTKLLADNRLYTSTTYTDVFLSSNSTITAFIAEVTKRDLGGGGGPRSMMVYEVQDQLIPTPALFENESIDFGKRTVQDIFEECGVNPSKPIRSQDPRPLTDRKALDDIVFDALELTEEERKEVYWAVCELVKNRLDKAKSV